MRPQPSLALGTSGGLGGFAADRTICAPDAARISGEQIAPDLRNFDQVPILAHKQEHPEVKR